MKFTINAEFSDDELKKHAEDVGRRWALNFIHDVVNHVGAMKLPKLDKKSAQELAAALVAAVKAAIQGAGDGAKKDATPDIGGDPDPFAVPPQERRCLYSIATPTIDACWFCCHCRTMNSDFRTQCRMCKHGRCDQEQDPGPHASTPNAHEDDPITA